MVAVLVAVSVLFLTNPTPTLAPHVEASYVPQPKACDISIEDCIAWYFPEDPRTAIAVFRAESQLKPRAIGYNCTYGQRVTYCQVKDRPRAISFDCGIAQIHSYDGVCKEEMFDLETNLQAARKLYDDKKWRHWYVWLDGTYKKYL